MNFPERIATTNDPDISKTPPDLHKSSALA